MSNANTENRATQQESVRKKVRDDTSFNAAFVIMNVCATIVACAGLFADSPAVVIGAMVIAVLLGPIMGAALAIADGEMRLLHTALVSGISGTLLVVATAIIMGVLFRDAPLTEEIRSRTAPTILDLFIALGGGAAGAYAIASSRLNLGLVGVAIATALVPPLSAAGILLARYQVLPALNALLLAFTNFAGIQFASSVVFWSLGYRQIIRPNYERQSLVPPLFVSASIVIVLAVVLTFDFTHHLAHYQFETAVRRDISKSLDSVPGSHLADLRFEYNSSGVVVVAVVRTPRAFAPVQVAEMEYNLPRYDGRPIELHVRSVIETETISTGHLGTAP